MPGDVGTWQKPYPAAAAPRATRSVAASRRGGEREGECRAEGSLPISLLPCTSTDHTCTQSRGQPVKLWRGAGTGWAGREMRGNADAASEAAARCGCGKGVGWVQGAGLAGVVHIQGVGPHRRLALLRSSEGRALEQRNAAGRFTNVQKGPRLGVVHLCLARVGALEQIPAPPRFDAPLHASLSF